ncbi:MAG: family 1 glycosylhydrolase [Actinomycetota bacterium]|nr:family 1 glycosylhydrolase [Actinomycetota bacterium]
MDLDVPRGFELGVATSSWQIEGDVAGRGRANWDDFAERPGAIVDGSTGEPACDHVHRLGEDLDLLGWLGVDAYRFSVSWPRVMPDGTGPLSPTGLDFYDRLVDGLLERGITPAATLFHWDLPSTLEEAGGWPSRDTAYRFADYAHAVGEHFAGRVDRWATLNEPWCSAFLGYCAGYFAPGRTEPGASLAAAYHLILGHGLAIERLRDAGARNLGIVLNLIPVISESPEMDAAARHVDGVQNRIFLDLLAGDGISDEIRTSCKGLTDWGFVRDEDRAVMSTPIDWLGENYYTVMRVAPLSTTDVHAIGQDVSMFPGCPPLSFVPRPPLTDMGWEILPEGVELALRMASDALPGIPLWICENGAAVHESTDATGIHDPIRSEYLEDHIRALLRARDKGFDVRGYYAWSLLDNLEWASGWTKKFGLVRVDPATGTRTPKDSAHWYRELLSSRSAEPPRS